MEKIYKVPESMVMRPDLVSIAEYDSDEYTDIILKYNNISNPFSLNKDDIILLPTINTIGNDIEDIIKNSDSSITDAQFIRNYHKYIDKSKAPTTIGSEKNNITIGKSSDSTLTSSGGSGGSDIYEEPNLPQNDNLWVKASGDRIYFNGSTPSTEND